MRTLTAFISLLAVHAASAGDYRNLCDIYGGYCCFAAEAGGAEPGFWFLESPNDENNHRIACESDTANSRLAVLDTPQKNACATRYIKDLRNNEEEYFLFGLQSTTQGVWEWQRVLSTESKTAEWQNWGPDQPDGDTGELCAFMSAGQNYHLSGFWEDVNCNTAGYFAICEQYVV